MYLRFDQFSLITTRRFSHQWVSFRHFLPSPESRWLAFRSSRHWFLSPTIYDRLDTAWSTVCRCDQQSLFFFSFFGLPAVEILFFFYECSNGEGMAMEKNWGIKTPALSYKLQHEMECVQKYFLECFHSKANWCTIMSIPMLVVYRWLHGGNICYGRGLEK